MSDSPKYVTTAELSAELRSMRWEMRALISTAALANLAVGYKIWPGAAGVMNFILGIF